MKMWLNILMKNTTVGPDKNVGQEEYYEHKIFLMSVSNFNGHIVFK